MSYDAWKLATPPEYDTEEDERRREEEQCARELEQLAEAESLAHRIAAFKCGVSDPYGLRLPDDLWKQALPLAWHLVKTAEEPEICSSEEEISF